MVRSAAPPRASTSEIASFHYLLSQKTTSSTVPGRGEAAASFATWDPAPPKDAVSGRVGLPVQVDFAVLACEALGGPQPVQNSIYKSVELVTNPRTTHDLSDPSLRDGGAYVDGASTSLDHQDERPDHGLRGR